MRLKLFVLFLSISFGLYAQSYTKLDSLYKEKAYSEANDEVNTQLILHPRSNYLHFTKGRILRYMQRRKEALSYLKDVANKGYPLGFYEIASMFYETYQFDRAYANMRVYAKKSKYNKSDSIVNSFYAQCAIAKRQLNYVKDIVVIDTMHVDREELLSLIKLSKDLGHFESLYSFVTGREDKKLFVDTLDGNSDIQLAYRYQKGWSKPQSLSGEVNTLYNETYPFECADGVTLYFASDKPKGLGGYDIYFSTVDVETNAYRQPKNIGMPFNSPANDYLLIIDELVDRGWFVSDRGMNSDSVIVYEWQPSTMNRMSQLKDSVSLKHFALLDSIKWGSASMKSISNVSDIENEEVEMKAFSFIITDAIIYHKLGDFKSKEALEAYKQLQRKQKERTILLNKLSVKRTQYAKQKDSSKAKSIVDLVLEMEQQDVDLFQEIEVLETKIRRAELAHNTNL